MTDDQRLQWASKYIAEAAPGGKSMTPGDLLAAMKAEACSAPLDFTDAEFSEWRQIMREQLARGLTVDQSVAAADCVIVAMRQRYPEQP